MKKVTAASSDYLVYFLLFVLRPTTEQVQHKAFFKVGPDAGPQPTRVRQNQKIPSAPSATPKGVSQRPGSKQQTIGKTIGEVISCWLSVTLLLSIFSLRHSSVQRIYDEWDVPINGHK